ESAGAAWGAGAGAAGLGSFRVSLPGGRGRAQVKWSGSAGRGRLYDAAVLAVRAGAAWVFAGHAVGRPLSWPTSPGAVLAWLELAGAALLAAGVAAPVCGAVLAGLAAAAVPAAAGAWPAGAELAALPSGASPASLALLGGAGLLAAGAAGALRPGPRRREPPAAPVRPRSGAAIAKAVPEGLRRRRRSPILKGGPLCGGRPGPDAVPGGPSLGPRLRSPHPSGGKHSMTASAPTPG